MRVYYQDRVPIESAIMSFALEQIHRPPLPTTILYLQQHEHSTITNEKKYKYIHEGDIAS